MRTSNYDERFVAPMRQELTQIGFEELTTPDQVDQELKNAEGTTLVDGHRAGVAGGAQGDA